jgi:hypothetical protein
MKSSFIAQVLRGALSHDYMLDNTYFFRWESDFFAVSKSGLIHEVEIKVSRSDYLADFKKVGKHSMLKAAKEGKEMVTIRRGLRYSVEMPAPRFRRQGDKEGDYVVRNRMCTELEPKLKEGEKNIVLIQSEIDYRKVFAPNRFYYACPKGMIKKAEVPKYAGLYWVEESGVLKVVKQAPILHKNKPDITGKLLHKFYHLSLNQRNDIRELRWQIENLNRLGGEVMGLTPEEGLQISLDIEG